METNLVDHAHDFAMLKHSGQSRKDDPAHPYFLHPLRVSELLREVAGVTDEEVLAAALLHDTLEDTETEKEELSALFGERVLSIVEELTDDKSLPKAERKKCRIETASNLSPEAALILVADKINNCIDVHVCPPAGWSLQRRWDYLQWAYDVVIQCPCSNRQLLLLFIGAIELAREELRGEMV